MRKSKIAKSKRLKDKYLRALRDWRTPRESTKIFNSCSVCGRTRWYMGKYDMCRICIREKANAWELPGMRKSSW